MEVEHKINCAACKEPLSPGRQNYTLRIDLFASSETIEVDDRELTRDRIPEISWLLNRLEHMSEAELLQEENRVFERFTFELCSKCRAIIHQHLHALHNKSEGEDNPPLTPPPKQDMH